MGTAVNSSNAMTLLELARRRDPKHKMLPIIESLSEDNPIITDAPFYEANGDKFHKCNRRSYVPEGSWRKYNEGVATVATRTRVVTFGMGMLQAYAENDVDLIKTFPDPVQARTDESMGIISGMGVHLGDTMFYGRQATAPEEFNGLAYYMPSLATTTNVLNAGGTGSDCTSIFIVQWGQRKVYMVYPKGHPFMGVVHKDLGEHTQSKAVSANDHTTSQLEIYRDLFKVDGGLVIADDRCIGRLANIESVGSANIFDENDLITLLNRMPNSGAGATLYANNTVITQMEIALKDKNNVHYTAAGGEGLAGEAVVNFRRHPVKKADQITITEAALT